MQAVLFEIQLIRSKNSASAKGLVRTESGKNFRPLNNSASGGNTDKNDDKSTHDALLEPGMLAFNRRGSQGIKSILLKGEMRYLKDINMLVFLCSPL